MKPIVVHLEFFNSKSGERIGKLKRVHFWPVEDRQYKPKFVGVCFSLGEVKKGVGAQVLLKGKVSHL